MDERTLTFWSMSTTELLDFLGTSENGLTDAEANLRLANYGENIISAPRYSGDLRIFVSQFKSPIILILIFAALLSFFLRDAIDALIILSIVSLIDRSQFLTHIPTVALGLTLRLFKLVLIKVKTTFWNRKIKYTYVLAIFKQVLLFQA